ncbi:MAG: hypothetical protein EOO38_08580 [Cytophagaceae bacterium]|nr:MAG: hypothetical protein EOO38_08580 [Cytophagaceae bacterium]
MNSNFLKIAFRNIFRDKGFSAINITGLAIGMAAAILIILWIQDEVTYDQFHTNRDRIYEVWNRVSVDGNISTSNSVSTLLAAAIEKEIPEVERSVRLDEQSEYLFAVDDKRLDPGGMEKPPSR